ncbi:hypothetical protein ACFXTH_012784 [Malus domestica]
MESRVSNLETKFDEFKTSQAKFRNECKARQAVILQQLQLLTAKYGGEFSAATPVHQPFIKMTSPISREFESSRALVLKLQSFREEKIRAREKADKFFSQFRQRYKPRSPHCLRPKLKKFKKVRNKHHNDKQREASVPILGFQSVLPATRLLLDSTSILGSAFVVSNVQKSNFIDHGYERMIIPVEVVGFHLGHNVFDELPHSTNNCVLQLGYHMSISDSGGALITGHFTSKFQVKDAYNLKFLVCNGEFLQNGTTDLRDEIELVVSNFCDKKSDESKIVAQTVKTVSLKLGFHVSIRDKGGTTIQGLFNLKSSREVETTLVQTNAAAQLVDALQFLGGFYNDAIVVAGFEFYYLMGIRDKGGGYLIISEYKMVLRFVRTKVANALSIQVGNSSFYLYKLPMVMRSGYLNRLVLQRISVGRDASPRIQLDNLPGGAKVFESVVKFCYGWTVDLTAANIALLYCAAHFLEMNTFRILRGCELISLCAKELKISKRSAEAIAWKACPNPNAFSFETEEIQCFNVLPNNAENLRFQDAADIWWFEDVSFLGINHFIEVIQALNCKGMRADLIGSCKAHCIAKWKNVVLKRKTKG